MPTVSVALCTYNGAAFLQEQLDSIAAQTRLPDELVIGDDRSSDATLALVERFRVHAPFPVRVLARTVNLGTSANFSETLRATDADLVFLSDQDDRWSPHKVAHMVAEFERRPDLLVLHTNARLVDASGQPLGMDLFTAYEVSAEELQRIAGGRAFDALIRRNVATGATMAVRQRLLRIALPAPSEWVHDEWLAIIASALGPGAVGVLDEALIDYRQHERNQIGARKLGLREKVARAFRARGTFYDEQLRRATLLRAKIDAIDPPVARDVVERLDEKLGHLRFRATLPRNRLRRVAPVLAELGAGRYARYSTGLRSVVRDLFERG